VVIAQAIALRPKLLIADEPTTALDVTTQAQILDLLKELVREEDMGLMLITHDLAVVAGLADSIAIMKDGAMVEAGPTREIFRAMRHPYTRALFEASAHVPERGRARTGTTPVLVGRECRPRLPAAAPQPVCQTPAVPRRRPCEFRDLAWGECRAGRRIRLRQVHPCPRDSRARRIAGWRHPAQRPRLFQRR
jgi:ABC-type dipeptide/oligopeptide/nickel transport system ATPase component